MENNILNKLKRENNKLFYKIVVEMGLLKTKNICADCGKKMDINNFHIQLCKECRYKYLDRYKL